MKCASVPETILFINLLFVITTSDTEVKKTEDKKFWPIHSWPKFNHFGQISAVDVDKLGNVYVFHRGDRRWDYSSFSLDNVFRDRARGPIPNETIVVLDSSEGALLSKTGENLFYLPHGLTVDDADNVWVTDVALHQVFKFSPLDLKKPGVALGEALLSLGVRFEPGSDKNHFCKPTAVAVDKETKEFYVSDGYCNSRLLKYDQQGSFLMSMGRGTVGSFHQGGYMLNVPHALSLAQLNQTLFVADRENARVLSYDFQAGTFKRSYAEELGSKIYAVHYSPLKGGLLFTLTNDPKGLKVVAVYGADSGKLILSFSPKNNFTNPHDLAVSHDGEYCYVVELDPFKAWKFKLDMDTISHLIYSSDGVKFTMEHLNTPLPAESKTDNTSSFEASSSLAVSLIISVIVISVLVFILHCYSKKVNYRSHEARSLALDDSEGGIQLTTARGVVCFVSIPRKSPSA